MELESNSGKGFFLGEASSNLNDLVVRMSSESARAAGGDQELKMMVLLMVFRLETKQPGRVTGED
ncbi:hypothetical protein CDL15_Pgr019901 [Punica granatum]|uniref:Uncharacterized protein n=1 Tax=Punica granatum TaxID=22663 RepID=A0A218X0R3_PUNGR|nr:hypothetical protein CDL15_Pgr019901 [Punica granatum]